MSQSSKPSVPKKVTPIKIQKIGPGNYSTTRAAGANDITATAPNNPEQETFADAVDPLNPFRIETRLYHLVHREDTKNTRFNTFQKRIPRVPRTFCSSIELKNFDQNPKGDSKCWSVHSKVCTQFYQ